MTFKNPASAELERLKEQKPRKMKIVPVPSGDQDDDWPQLARDDYYLPDLDGREDVQVICIGYEKVKPKRFGKHAKPTLYLYFQITDGAHMEKILWGPYPIPEDARKISPSSKYARAWCVANDGPPDRKQHLIPKVFVGKVFYARVRSVTHDRRKKPLAHPYSIIDDIVKLGP